MKIHKRRIFLAALCLQGMSWSVARGQDFPAYDPQASPSVPASTEAPASAAPRERPASTRLGVETDASTASSAKPEAAPADASAAQTAAAAGATAETSVEARAEWRSPVETLAREGKPWIGHRPVNAKASGDLSLWFDVRGADLVDRITVHYRPVDAPEQAPSRRDAQVFEGGYMAVLPAGAATAPGLVYWVEATLSDGSTQAVFADAGAPHPVALNDSFMEARRERMLRYFEGRSSVLGVRGEYVDLGVPPGATARDGYGAFGAYYQHRFLGWVDELEVGLGLLRGRAVEVQDLSGADSEDDPDPPGDGDQDDTRVGINHAYGRVTFRLNDWLRLRGSMLLGVYTEGFTPGVDGAILLGYQQATELAFHAGTIEDHGGHAGLRLGWRSVPGFPMGATVEATNFPDASVTGVRLLYDVAYEWSPGRHLKIEAGYRGRTALSGGLSIGTEIAWSL